MTCVVCDACESLETKEQAFMAGYILSRADEAADAPIELCAKHGAHFRNACESMGAEAFPVSAENPS